MKVKTITCAIILSAMPVVSFALGCSGHKQQAQSCAAGTVWDAASESCVEAASS